MNNFVGAHFRACVNATYHNKLGVAPYPSENPDMNNTCLDEAQNILDDLEDKGVTGIKLQ